MDFALLILYLAFITTICYIVTHTVLYVFKRKDKEISDKVELSYKNCYTLQPYTSICNEASYKALIVKDGSDVQNKYKETLPKHSTRIKLREVRKLRNKHKENK